MNNRVRVIGTNSVPTYHGDGVVSLVLLELDLCSKELESAVTALRYFCKIPQYPWHCTLGVTRKVRQHDRIASQLLRDARMQGLELKLNWTNMGVLGPSSLSPSECNGYSKVVPALEQQNL
jgi:hypothetical protein